VNPRANLCLGDPAASSRPGVRARARSAQPHRALGATPLWAACSSGHLNIVRYLAEDLPVRPLPNSKSYPCHKRMVHMLQVRRGAKGTDHAGVPGAAGRRRRDPAVDGGVNGRSAGGAVPGGGAAQGLPFTGKVV
jgi:hypothetical protein